MGMRWSSEDTSENDPNKVNNATSSPDSDSLEFSTGSGGDDEGVEEITITNTKAIKIKFKFDAAPSTQCTITANPSTGSIAPGKDKKIKLKAELKEKGNFQFKLTVHLGNESHFLTVRVRSVDGVFGTDPSSLDNIDDGTGRMVPEVLVLMKNSLIESNGLVSEGIFRLAGDTFEIAALKDQMNKKTFVKSDNINTVATLIKVWFRELPIPILNQLPSEAIFYSSEPDKCVEAYQSLIEPSKTLLTWLMDLLIETTAHSNINKMTPQNLAIVVAPNLYDSSSSDPMEGLVMSQKVVQFLNNLLLFHLEKTTGSAPVVLPPAASIPIQKSKDDRQQNNAESGSENNPQNVFSLPPPPSNTSSPATGNTPQHSRSNTSISNDTNSNITSSSDSVSKSRQQSKENGIRLNSSSPIPQSSHIIISPSTSPPPQTTKSNSSVSPSPTAGADQVPLHSSSSSMPETSSKSPPSSRSKTPKSSGSISSGTVNKRKLTRNVTSGVDSVSSKVLKSSNNNDPSSNKPLSIGLSGSTEIEKPTVTSPRSAKLKRKHSASFNSSSDKSVSNSGNNNSSSSSSSSSNSNSSKSTNSTIGTNSGSQKLRQVSSSVAPAYIPNDAIVSSKKQPPSLNASSDSIGTVSKSKSSGISIQLPSIPGSSDAPLSAVSSSSSGRKNNTNSPPQSPASPSFSSQLKSARGVLQRSQSSVPPPTGSNSSNTHNNSSPTRSSPRVYQAPDLTSPRSVASGDSQHAREYSAPVSGIASSTSPRSGSIAAMPPVRPPPPPVDGLESGGPVGIVSPRKDSFISQQQQNTSQRRELSSPSSPLPPRSKPFLPSSSPPSSSASPRSQTPESSSIAPSSSPTSDSPTSSSSNVMISISSPRSKRSDSPSKRKKAKEGSSPDSNDSISFVSSLSSSSPNANTTAIATATATANNNNTISSPRSGSPSSTDLVAGQKERKISSVPPPMPAPLPASSNSSSHSSPPNSPTVSSFISSSRDRKASTAPTMPLPPNPREAAPNQSTSAGNAGNTSIPRERKGSMPPAKPPPPVPPSSSSLSSSPAGK